MGPLIAKRDRKNSPWFLISHMKEYQIQWLVTSWPAILGHPYRSRGIPALSAHCDVGCGELARFDEIFSFLLTTVNAGRIWRAI